MKLLDRAIAGRLLWIRRLPWEPDDGRRRVIGLVPLLLYRVNLVSLGWLLDRQMPQGVRAGFWK